jgi:tRNA threonylcarbamoyladenosine biosynthesis protein TsaE
MTNQLICNSTNDLTDIAKQLLNQYPNNRVFALYGGMGAGKTTFMKYLCAYLQSSDIVTSPTFTIVNEYELPNNSKLYHFDFYRIKNLQEAIEIGFDEYLYSGYYCFIEWPENVESLLPQDTIHIQIETKNLLSEGKRIFTF